MKTKTTLGWFVLETAQGNAKTHVLQEKQAEEVRDCLSQRIDSKVEKIRSSQRRAFEESKAITVF
ncbi:hypothetical protein [Lacisediminimonas profundi]|uniref:hypothetical protein n=1 Tax=Lacisediminimonas profundi TaxID=2603856 RepID=UPI00124AFD59|nr:hypothetical protein [Lacisediminimonas profundi]